MSDQKRKGIYLLPNLLTTAGLFSGFFAVVSSMNGRFEAAAVAIFVAMIFDGLDGRVARMTNTQSDFGAEYDSMADMVSFGMAPALVAYNWGLTELGKLGWLAAFIYVAGAALRLARFNTQVGIADKRFFQGLASPAAAAVVSGLVWVGVEYDAVGTDYGLIVAAVVPTIIAGLIGGSFVVETIFQIPGLGRFYVEAAFNRDYTMILGTTIFFSALIIFFNLLSDIAVLLMNPRARNEV